MAAIGPRRTRGRGMDGRPGAALLALAALLLCTAEAAASSSGTSSSSSTEVTTGGGPGTTLQHANVTFSQESRSPPKPREPGGRARSFPSGAAGPGPPPPSPPLCAYRVAEGGGGGGAGGQLCFRQVLPGYECRRHEEDCRSAVSSGSLVANLLANGSVLLQWSHEGESSPDATGAKTAPRRGGGGYELGCWWNGSYTQFECAGVHLGSGCRDFLLTELHENIPYRLCLRPLGRGEDRVDCVEFVLPPTGMQDIVIAMTTVGGAICVMLVIICLLVAYITENIMSPTAQHTYSYHTHSRH